MARKRQNKHKQAPPPTFVRLFAATIFLSAFLLFQVQPMIGKYILPWFGSTPGVWATALLFFQLTLLAGYTYAHLLVSFLNWRRQAIVHASLLALALITFPIAPEEALKPMDPEAPVGRILLILSLSVGAPFFLLSATAPLLQRWFAVLHPHGSPYRLYALSNVGSLLALLSYPFVIERLLQLQTQTWIWTLGYVVFVGLCAACGWQLLRSPVGAIKLQESAEAQSATDVTATVDGGRRPGLGQTMLWLSLAACGSGLLMATTNQMSLDIAAVPLLWVIPLSLYLLTFILCFESERWYIRPLFAALLPLALINTVRLLHFGTVLGIMDQITGYSLTLFVCCMCCHGELSRLRPAPAQLTFFFLIVSVGGALGGAFVALLAPAFFPGVYEIHILLLACFALMIGVQMPQLFRKQHDNLNKGGNGLEFMLTRLCWAVTVMAILAGAASMLNTNNWYAGYNVGPELAATFSAWRGNILMATPLAIIGLLLTLEMWRQSGEETFHDWWYSSYGLTRLGVSTVLAIGVLSLTGAMTWQIQEKQRQVVEQARNFYGVIAIKEEEVAADDHRLLLINGRINHGSQSREHPTFPTSYYGPATGVGLAIRYHPQRADPSREFRVGVVGLGVGTLAAYANARFNLTRSYRNFELEPYRGVPDYTRFYELNPLVTQWAQQRFSFLRDAASRGANVEVFEGDARIVLERQLRLNEAQRFDVLVIDAFSSDAIPLHLLTQESFQTYLGHLATDGILAIHVSNRYTDLLPIIARHAEAMEIPTIRIVNELDQSRFTDASDWILLTNNDAFLNKGAVRRDEQAMPAPGPLWTDHFSSLIEVIDFSD